MKTDMLFNIQLFTRNFFKIIANQVDVVQVLNKSLNKRLHKKKTEL